MKKVRFFSVAALAYAIMISIALLACGDALDSSDPHNTLGDPIKGPIRVNEH